MQQERFISLIFFSSVVQVNMLKWRELALVLVIVASDIYTIQGQGKSSY